MKETGIDSFNIPNEPKIPLENYLLKLVGEKDGIGNSLYVYNVEDIIKEIWNEIIEKGNIIVRQLIPKKLKMQTSPFYSVLKGKRGISIQQLYELLRLWKVRCNKTDKDLEQKWNKIYNSNFLIASFSKPQKILLPKFLTPKLAYLIGWIVGDGCFDSHGNHYRIKINDKNKRELEDVLKPIIEETLHVDCFVRKDHPSHCIKIHSKPVFRFFTSVLNVEVGKIPLIMKEANVTIKQYFLRGIFDSEGDINPDYLSSKIRISQASKSFLEKLLQILRDIDIAANGPYGPKYKYPTENWNVFSKWYYIEIRKKSEIFKFIKTVSSSHLDKLPKMKFLSREIKNKYIHFQKLRKQLKEVNMPKEEIGERIKELMYKPEHIRNIGTVAHSGT